MQIGGDDLQLAAAYQALLEVDPEGPPEQPGQANLLTCSRPAIHQCPLLAESVSTKSGR